MEHAAGDPLAYRFAVALAIGLLIGLQRQYEFMQGDKREAGQLFAGMRTFALLGLLGCSAAFLGDTIQAAPVLLVTLAIAGLLLGISHYIDSRNGAASLTSEVAALLTLICGALCYHDQAGVSAAIAVSASIILAARRFIDDFLKVVTLEDISATLKFAAITVIILPTVPDEPLFPPPFDVLVPYKIWLMVCLISGISFLGYILIKVVGSDKGIGLVGLLGGLASSTAVTATFAQRSQDVKGLEKPFALAILLAWLVMFVRVIVEVAAVNQDLLSIIWKPLLVVALVTTAYCYYLRQADSEEANQHDAVDFSNPFRLGPAIKFGVVYGIILVVANVARIEFGEQGVYLSSIVSGLVDVDAITLSMAELSRNPEELSQETAARAIIIAATTNTVVKGGIVLSTGSEALRKVILPGLLLIVLAAAATLFFV